jgi:uncharacterized Fe-S radical SAM superfamily protein PflX
VAKVLEILRAQKRLSQQRREIKQLRDELENMRAQNESMRQGMRRCVTCEYRIDVKRRQDEGLEKTQPLASTETTSKPG